MACGLDMSSRALTPTFQLIVTENDENLSLCSLSLAIFAHGHHDQQARCPHDACGS